MGIWTSWSDVTRFLRSTRIAQSREYHHWYGLALEGEGQLKIDVSEGKSRYKLNLSDHLQTVNDEHLLCSTALIYSYALAESAARNKLGLTDDDELSGGIESWGTNILKSNGQSWTNVKDGKGGCVEVAVIRNALSHGQNQITQTMLKRLGSQKISHTWTTGAQIKLDLAIVELYRARLRSLLRNAGVK